MTTPIQQPSPSKTGFATNIVWRWVTFVLGIMVMAVGIALSVHSQLGTAPVSTIPAVLDAATNMSVGTFTILMNVSFVAIQILILRRQFQLFQLVQLPISLLFGLILDAAVFATQWVQPTTYIQQWLVVILGAVVLGIGVYIQIQPKLVYLPGEGIVMALTQVIPIRFGTMKQLVDWTVVIIAVIMSLLLMQRLEGVREGTVFAAFAVGAVVKIIQRLKERFTAPNRL